MKYILALAGLAAGAAAFFFYSVAESAIHEGVAMMAACACLIGIGSATITHAIDVHREKMEDIEKDKADETRQQYSKLLAAVTRNKEPKND